MNISIKRVIIIIIIIILLMPIGVRIYNTYLFTIQKSNDTSNYITIKQVEDTCRAMIASYGSDKLVYEQYKDSNDDEKQSWAEQAKIRANKTALIYNSYILKNNFIWKNNVPPDIKEEIPTIK